jgi:hypothetical protein
MRIVYTKLRQSPYWVIQFARIDRQTRKTGASLYDWNITYSASVQDVYNVRIAFDGAGDFRQDSKA